MSDYVAVDEPREGDMAWHKTQSLDPRRVARVLEEMVWLEIGTSKPMGPFPASNYTYQRRAEVG